MYLAVVVAEGTPLTVNVGYNATFILDVASPPGLSYEWRRNRIPLMDGARISGVNTSNLNISHVIRDDEGGYTALLSLDGAEFETRPASLGIKGNLVFHDDFSSGDLGNWTGAPGATSPALSGTHTRPGSDYAVQSVVTTDKIYHDLEEDAGGHARAIFWIYDNGQTHDVRWFGEVRSFGGGAYSTNPDQVLAIGKYRHPFDSLIPPTGTLIDEKVNFAKYQGRILFGENSGWFNLDAPGSPNASIGWHKFEIERMPDGTTINFYVDGILSRTITGADYAKWDVVTVGSVGSYSNPNPVSHDAWFGEVAVESLPLPWEEGLQQWFSVDFKEEGENYLITEEEGGVAGWIERVSNSVSLIQENTLHQPKFIAGTEHASGYGTIRFSGNGEFLTGESALTNEMEHGALVFVWRPAYLQDAILWEHSNAEGSFAIKLTSSGTYGLAINGVMTEQVHLYQEHEHIVSVLTIMRDEVTGETDAVLYHNTQNHPASSTTVGFTSFVNPTTLRIGGDDIDGYFVGELQELLTYKAYLGPDEIGFYTDLFETAYGLSLDRTGDGLPDDPNGDASWDGIPNSWLIAQGLNPWDPYVAWSGFDLSGLTWLEKYQLDEEQHGHWSLISGTGLVGEDDSGNGNHGTLSDPHATWRPDGFGIALDGQGQVTVGNPPDGSLDLGASSLTMSAWFRTTDAGLKVFLSKGAYDSSPGYAIGLANAGQIFATIGGSTEKLHMQTINHFNNGKWHHVAAVFDRIQEKAWIYVDGEKQQITASQDGNVVDGETLDFSGITSPTGTSDKSLFIGAMADANNSPVHRLTGDLADVRLYGTALSVPMINALYTIDTKGGGIPNKWMFAHFDDLSFDPDHDYLGDAVTLRQAYNLDLNPKVSSTYGDGLPDWWKVDHFAIYIEGMNQWIWILPSPKAGDRYLSSVTLLQAYQLGLNPRETSTANDGLPDSWKVEHFAEFNDTLNEWSWITADRDPLGDPDQDDLTNAGEFAAGTDPMNPDTDGDEMTDGWEVVFNLDPLDDGQYDFFLGPDGDVSLDGLTNLEKFKLGHDPHERYAHHPPEFYRNSTQSLVFNSGPRSGSTVTIWMNNPNPVGTKSWTREPPLGVITYTTDGSEPRSSDARLKAEDDRYAVAGVIDPADPRIVVSGTGNHVIKARVFSLGAEPSPTTTLLLTLGTGVSSKRWYRGKKRDPGTGRYGPLEYTDNKAWYDAVDLGKGWIIGSAFVPDLREDSEEIYYGRIKFTDGSSYTAFSYNKTDFALDWQGAWWAAVGHGWILSPSEIKADTKRAPEDVYYMKHDLLNKSFYTTQSAPFLKVNIGKGWIDGLDSFIPDPREGPSDVWAGRFGTNGPMVFSKLNSFQGTGVEMGLGWITSFTSFKPDVRNKAAGGMRTVDPADSSSSKSIYKSTSGPTQYRNKQFAGGVLHDQGWLTSTTSYIPDDASFRDDTDGDGLIDGFEEHLYGTDKANPDTSGDYLNDWQKAVHWNSLSSSERTMDLHPAGYYDMDGDIDGDGLSNYQEFMHGTLPFQTDTDGDGVSDRAEILQGSNPRNPEDSEPVEDLVTVFVTIGDWSSSESEVWKMAFNGGGSGGLELTSPLGDVKERVPLRLERGKSHSITVEWVATKNSEEEGPDYDYEAGIDLPDGTLHSLRDEDGLLGQHEQGADDEFVGEGLEAKLALYSFYLEREGEIRMAARTEWSEQEEADYTRKIWVRVSPDIEAELLATVELSVDKLSKNPQYNPPGFGEFKQSDTDPFEWTYTAFAEPRLEQNAMFKQVFPILSAKGKTFFRYEEEAPLLIVMPVFDFLAHWKSIPFKEPQAKEAYEFIWWRYGDLFGGIPAADPVIAAAFDGTGNMIIPERQREVGFSDYDFDFAHDADRGITDIDNSVVFGKPAFALGENAFAMTVAHELFHTGQSPERRIAAGVLERLKLKKHFIECEVYRYLLSVFVDYGVKESDDYFTSVIIPSLKEYCGIELVDEGD